MPTTPTSDRPRSDIHRVRAALKALHDIAAYRVDINDGPAWDAIDEGHKAWLWSTPDEPAALASSAPAGGVEAATCKPSLQVASGLTAPADEVRAEAEFLWNRLQDLDSSTFTEESARDFHGHVAPSMARLRAALDAGDGGAAAGAKLTTAEAIEGLNRLRATLDDPKTDNWTKLQIVKTTEEIVDLLSRATPPTTSTTTGTEGRDHG